MTTQDVAPSSVRAVEEVRAGSGDGARGANGRRPTAAGLIYSDTGGYGPVVVLLHGVLISGTLWDEVVGGLRGSLPLHRLGVAVRRAHHADAR